MKQNTETTFDMEPDQPPPSILSDIVIILAITLNGVGIGYFVTSYGTHLLAIPRMEPWLIARATGITAYFLLWLLALAGIILSHPKRTRIKVLHPVTRMRLHTLLALFTLSFVVLHIMAVILDSYANVGVVGSLVPFESKYRSLPVALGTLGLYAGIVTGICARFRIGITGKGWISIHRFSMLAVVAIWLHAVLVGTDSPALATLYLLSAGILILSGLSRYTASKPATKTRLITK